ncbi:MAG: outer membrane beta-barrel protein [Rhodoferax sp.]|nr:outer membrane beta-barrel protein [Rhodoferax sp.]
MKFTSSALAITALLATSSGTALAQASAQTNFIGPAIGLTVTAVQTKVDYESTVPSINGQSTQANDSDAALTASYGFAMSQNWVGTVGFSYGLKTSDAGSVTYTAGGTQTFTTKFKDHIVLSFAPGYRVSSSVLVYGKLAYHQVKSDYTDTATTSGSTNHTGTGMGLGVAFAIDPKLELRAEYESVAYSGEKAQLTTGKPKQNGLTFGLLYKF